MMNIQELRQSLKLKWLNYYQKNHSWLVKMRVWATYDGERRPLSSFILATLSVLEPKLEQVFPFILELSNNPDQIISALGLNFNPEQQLHLIDSHHHTHNNDRTHERSLRENPVYDRQPRSGGLSHREMADEQAMMQNTNLMTMLVDEEETRRHRYGGGLNHPPIGSHQIADFDGGGEPLGLNAPNTELGTQSATHPRVPASPRHPVNQSIASPVAVKPVDKPSPDFVREETETAETFFSPVGVLVNQDNTKTQSTVEEIPTPTLPTRTSPAVTTVKDYPISPPTEPPLEKVPQSLPLHTFVLDEVTGVFHQPEPEFKDVPQPPEEESPAYTLGETICIPSIAADNQSVSPSDLRENQPEPEGKAKAEEDVFYKKKKRFNLASWVDDFCQGTGWDKEDAIILPF